LREVLGFCTDSGAQLPPDLLSRHGIAVVPLTVTVDGVDHQEGVDLDADELYDRFAHGRTPSVQTAAPPPGRFLDAGGDLAARGATEIISIHTGSEVSSTLDAARIAAEMAPVPVHLVDSHTASFAVGCCTWEAAEVAARGGSAEEAIAVAEKVAASVGNVFVVSALDLVRAGGRLASGTAEAEGIPVLSLVDGRIRAVGAATSLDDACDQMAAYVLALGHDLRVGLSIADRGAAPIWEGLEARLADRSEVRELVRYRVGPSVGAHSGPGTAGAVAYPALSS
jgi:DegV family protein with EDD domain